MPCPRRRESLQLPAVSRMWSPCRLTRLAPQFGARSLVCPPALENTPVGCRSRPVDTWREPQPPEQLTGVLGGLDESIQRFRLATQSSRDRVAVGPGVTVPGESQGRTRTLPYLSLFITAFVAATLLPAYSELVVGSLIL